MEKRNIRQCFVPECTSSSSSTPNKLFILLPSNLDRRRKWAEAVGNDKKEFVYCPNTKVYCCEDHFNLQEDVENWIYFKTVGGKIKMRPEIVPHINIKQKENKQCEANSRSSVSTSETGTGITIHNSEKKHCSLMNSSMINRTIQILNINNQRDPLKPVALICVKVKDSSKTVIAYKEKNESRNEFILS